MAPDEAGLPIHRHLPRRFASRRRKPLHEAARVPPMDYRDNPQHRAPNHIKRTSFTPPSGLILLRPSGLILFRR